MSNDEKNNLKLIGKNEEDLKFISAYLQDGIVFVKNVIFLKKYRTFIMILNRFMWEVAEKGVFEQNKRIKCAVRFEEVIKVQSKNINQKNNKKPLEYLAIKSSFMSNNFFKIEIFSICKGLVSQQPPNIVAPLFNIFFENSKKSCFDNYKSFPLFY